MSEVKLHREDDSGRLTPMEGDNTVVEGNGCGSKSNLTGQSAPRPNVSLPFWFLKIEIKSIIQIITYTNDTFTIGYKLNRRKKEFV